MPAPIIAPTPSAVSWKGPSVRFRLCPPTSSASESNMLIGFLANKGLPMQLLLWGSAPLPDPTTNLALSIVGAQPAAPLQKNPINSSSKFLPAAATTTTRADTPEPQSRLSPDPFPRSASDRAAAQT